ncbi:MAG: LemA family protein [Luteolibacter sp.]|uniref:LemA family protein n=1 Tax=Luteolibacter sp. TaxID=1962973 RepID=UPI00326388D6
MNKIWIVLIAIVGLVVVLGLSVAGSYNGLVGKQQGVDAAWANVLNQYQRRADLVPNLVKTVQGSADFEKSTLEAVVNARASVGKVTVDPGKSPEDPATLQKFQEAQGQFTSALSRLLVVAENYPDLKASAGFRDLQAQLEGTENRISVERGRFNDVAKEYNTGVRSFPAVLFAGIFGFHPKPYFQSDAGAEKAPDVKFDFGGTPAPAH